MIYSLLTFGMIVILLAGMILAVWLWPHEETGREGAANRRLDCIRKSSLLR